MWVSVLQAAFGQTCRRTVNTAPQNGSSLTNLESARKPTWASAFGERMSTTVRVEQRRGSAEAQASAFVERTNPKG